MNAAIESELGVGGVGPAALIAIDVEPGILVERLATHLRRGQSSMVRAVQVLESRGLVEKRPGRDRRTLGLYLTRKGHKTVANLLDRRSRVLDKALAALSSGELKRFEKSIGLMLEALIERADDRYPMCRLCDEAACGPADSCPVERGAAACRHDGVDRD
ncbi:MAG: MarR family winged helix-turn-helix transcriptional regulator [Dongiaceae bacterium]